MTVYRIFIFFLSLIFSQSLSWSAEAPDVRIVFWFDRSRPLDTFKFQSYDLCKKEFTSDVERWLKLMKRDYPGYDTYTRDVELSLERGETDNLKIGSVILREFYVVGDRYGYTLAGYPGSYARPATRLSPSTVPVWPRALQGPGAGASYPGTPASSSPFPVPFPRPHP